MSSLLLALAIVGPALVLHALLETAVRRWSDRRTRPTPLRRARRPRRYR